MTDTPGASVLDVYRRHGRAWAALRTGRLVERGWIDRFCALVPADGAVLDIGCGSGVPIARDLVRRGIDVTGIDGAATMLTLFRRNVPTATAHLADMRQLALGRRFAGLIAWDSFFHLPPDDQRAMFSRFAAHAAPGAALMFTTGAEAGEAIGTLADDPLYHASLDPAEYRALIDAAGFATVAHVVADPACGGRTVWLARRSD